MKKTPLKILITAGPTQEPIDPVRYLTNRSSGKMGFALAKAALKNQAQVMLITGPVALKTPVGAECIRVNTALEMLSALKKNILNCDVLIMAAAVADFRPGAYSKHKIKKGKEGLSLKLVQNPDLLKSLKPFKKPHQIFVGFAAETQNEIKAAQTKLKNKNLDWIVVNNVSKPGVGFDSDDNEATLISKTGSQIFFKKQTKVRLAQNILKVVLKM